MKDTSALHDVGHSLGLWLFSDTTAWFEFVLHTVLVVTPFALALLFGWWIFQIFRQIARRYRDRFAQAPHALAPKAQSVGIFGYVFKHTRRSQLLLLVAAMVALPLIYAGLELPKLIINNAISSGHFPVEIFDQPLSQTNFLFLLSGTVT